MNLFTGLLGPPRLSYFQIPVETFTDPFDCRGRPIVTRMAAFVKGRGEKLTFIYYACPYAKRARSRAYRFARAEAGRRGRRPLQRKMIVGQRLTFRFLRQ